MNPTGRVSTRKPYQIHHPTDQRGWTRLARRFGDDPQIGQCFQIAARNGCRTVLVEDRYVDADYRSEFSNYWSLKFVGRSGFTRRLHFFGSDISDGCVHTIPEDADYIGYLIVRPVSGGRVGRSMLRPPPDLAGPEAKNLVIATSSETVSVYGVEFTVEGVPFCSQDGEFIRCAHAAVWICHYSAHTRGLTARHLTAQLVGYTPPAFTHDRPLPSKGLTYAQMQAVFHSLGHPANIYFLGDLPNVHGIRDAGLVERERHRQLVEEAKKRGQPEPPRRHPGYWDTRIYSIVRRHLDSGFPVVIATAGHAFVLAGYYEEIVDGKTRTRLIAFDDQVGPYEIIPNALEDERGPWEAILIPLPPRVWLPGETAENDAANTILSWRSGRGATREDAEEWVELSQRMAAGELKIKTLLLQGRDYKRRVGHQGRHVEVVRALRLASLSHWVWVIEAQAGSALRDGSPAVLAEFVYDSTLAETTTTPYRLAASSLGLTTVTSPDTGTRHGHPGLFDPWRPLLSAPSK